MDLIPKKMIIDRQEGQTKGICVLTVLALWYCGYLTNPFETELRMWKKSVKSWGCIHTFGFEECRSVKEISTAIRFMPAATREWEPERSLSKIRKQRKSKTD